MLIVLALVGLFTIIVVVLLGGAVAAVAIRDWRRAERDIEVHRIRGVMERHR